MRKRICKVCKKAFKQSFSTLQVTCSIECAIKHAQKLSEAASEARRKENRKKLRVAKDKLKSRSEWLREAQTACNAYIRYRDRDKPCISCGTNKPDIQYCAGHYKTRGGHPELRFHPLNIHKQCNKHCNLMKSGNISEYRPRLIEKIGLQNVEWLEGKHEPQKWTIDEIKEIKDYYKQQLKWIKNNERLV